MAIARRAGVESNPRIRHLQQDPLTVFCKQHLDAGRLRVLDRVAQRLLSDAIGSLFGVERQIRLLVHRQVDADPVAGNNRRGLPGYAGDQAVVRDGVGSKPEDDGPQLEES